MNTLTKLGFVSLITTMAGCLDGMDDAQVQQELASDEAGAADDGSKLEAQADVADDGSKLDAQAAAAPVASLVGCTGYACDNKDPVAMGCTAGAQLLRTAWITYSSSYLAKVEGWYSATCGAQWTRVINWSASPATISASQAQNGILYGQVFANNAPTNWSVNSKMFSAAYFMQACGDWGFGYSNCSTGY
jgi:hypothetical protein